MTLRKLDFTENPRREIGDKILSVATILFESVKNAPLDSRKSFPKILRNNNFGLASFTTKTHVFLEVSAKSRAQRDRQSERVTSYKRMFVGTDSKEPAAARIERSRIVRFSNVAFKSAHGFAIGSDISMSAWDSKITTLTGERECVDNIDVIYVVGFGDSIREDVAWQEIDSLIRVTISGWFSGE
jgi:hypothetical protein